MHQQNEKTSSKITQDITYWNVMFHYTVDRVKHVLIGLEEFVIKVQRDL